MSGSNIKSDDNESLLKKVVSRCAGPEGVQFWNVVTSLPGMYPADVYQSMQQLDIGPIDWRINGNGNCSEDVTWLSKKLQALPTPHPLDFDWRFSAGTSAAIADKVARSDVENVACLCCTSVGIALGMRHADLNVQIIDHNLLSLEIAQSMGGNIRVMHRDLLDDEPPSTFADALIADPPWYGEYWERLCMYAARALKVDGELIAAIPPLGARPNIPRERAEWLATAASYGLTVESCLEKSVIYWTPYFERNALLSFGLQSVHPMWRSADLVVLIKNRAVEKQASSYVGERAWDRVRVGKMEWRVSPFTGEIQEQCAGLNRVYASDVADTVSRRDSRRRTANVWTTGNRALSCATPAQVLRTAQSLTGLENPENAAREMLSRSDISQLEKDVARITLEECGELLKYSYD